MNAASYQSKLQIPSNWGGGGGEGEGEALIQLGWRERSLASAERWNALT